MPMSERLGAHLKRVEQELMTAKHAAVKPAGLTVPQYAALLVLTEQPGISAAALARACLVTPQTMTTILQNLLSLGLVERTPHPVHRNVLETRLTGTGAAAVDRADVRAVAVERRLADEFTAEERATLVALLGRCSTALAGGVD